MSQIIKPQPLVLGNKAHYTLSSYDPVTVEVYVPRVTSEELDLMEDQVLAQAGGTRASLGDPAWMAAKLQGIRSEDELRQALREEIEAANEGQVEQTKENACLDKLAERLNQSVLQADVQAILDDLVASFEQDMGASLGSIATQMGAQRQAIEQMFAESAQRMAEQEAALDAYASEKKLSVDESEYAGLLGLPRDEAKQVIAQAKSMGRSEALRQAALRSKAERAVFAECSCTYHHETEDEAARRLEVLKERLAQQGAFAAGSGGGNTPAGTNGSGLKLV